MNKLKLKNEQKEVFGHLLRYLYVPNPQMQLLTGPAGSGKTFVIATLVNEISSRFKNKIGLCAPTHKATRVLENELSELSNVLVFGTIHSLLGLRPELNQNTGEVTFVRDYDSWNRITGLKILFLDEVPMLEDQIFYHLLEEQRRGLKIIFVGDPYQIPPINKLDAIPLLPKFQENYNIKKYHLTNIYRQEEQSKIIVLSNHIKNNLEEEYFDFNSLYESLELKKDITIVDKDDFEKQIEILKQFTTIEARNDADFIKVLAWTNNEVEKYNGIIRHLLYDTDELPKLMEQEKIILTAPIIKNKKIVLNNNDELIIDSYEIKTEVILEISDDELKYYDAIATNDRDGKAYQLKIIHEDSEEIYEKNLKDLKSLALKVMDKREKSNIWKLYYLYKEKNIITTIP